MHLIRLHQVTLEEIGTPSSVSVTEVREIFVNPEYIVKFMEANKVFSENNRTRSELNRIDNNIQIGYFPTLIKMADGEILKVAESPEFILSRIENFDY